MSELTVIFPTAAALFVLLLCSEYIRTRALAPRRETREVHMQKADHWTAWGLATLYAGTDELHQRFVSDRGPALLDVGIDSAGALTGALVATLLLALLLRRAAKRATR